jgi:hypothetical protein
LVSIKNTKKIIKKLPLAQTTPDASFGPVFGSSVGSLVMVVVVWMLPVLLLVVVRVFRP